MIAIQSYSRADDPAGRAFDRTSDSIDQINVGRLHALSGEDAYEKARFDEGGKDRESFRNFAEDDPAKLLYV